MISRENKQQVIADVQTSKTDTGSPSVQAAVLTARIKELTAHLQTNKKDHAARRGLLQMVGQRKRLLRYLSERDNTEYLRVVEKLGLRK